MENNCFIVLIIVTHGCTFILMSHNMTISYFYLPSVHVLNTALSFCKVLWHSPFT